MDKEFADKMISQFQKKFFGYALSKCNDMAEAEELASRITCEAYMTLRTVEDVYNWEGYLYKIAANVYARYVKEQVQQKSDNISDMEVQSEENFEAEYIKKEELELLKREVAWLSKRHREIVLLHYYHNKKLAEIAEILELPEGTVKWHLSDAKKLLKKGMKQMRTEGNLGLEPIKLVRMGNIGSVGQMGDTSEFLNSKLRQNIAYAAYFEPKTIEEIAKELGVSPVFIEDEVAYLEEYGFLDLLPGQKHRTNIYIDCLPYEAVQKAREIEAEVARIICDEYVPEVVKLAEHYDKKNIYVPEDDFNYFLWSVIPMAVCEYSIGSFDWQEIRRKNYMVKRKDGGDYAAIARLYQPQTEELLEKEYVCGPMYAGDEEIPVFAWVLSTNYEDRAHGPIPDSINDYQVFQMYLKGNLPKSEALLDKYIRLYDRGLLRQTDDAVNVIVVKESLEKGLFSEIKKHENGEYDKIDFAGSLRNYLPKMPDTLREKLENLIEKKIRFQKEYQPKHMHGMVEIYEKARQINIYMVIEELLKREILKPLTDDQKKGVMTVVHSDTLPGEN